MTPGETLESQMSIIAKPVVLSIEIPSLATLRARTVRQLDEYDTACAAVRSCETVSLVVGLGLLSAIHAFQHFATPT